jgi:signal transduction histidine kinase
MHDRVVLRLDHMRDDPRSSGFPAHHPHMDRLLGVPVQAGPQLFGMLYLTDRLDDLPFTEEDQWLVESLAGYAALAIAGTYLSDQRGRLTLLEERERVGMELHDGIIQSLYAIGMQLELLKLTQPAISDDVAKATRSLDAVIEDIRRYILNLKVAAYEQQTMRECLQDVIARLHIPDELTIEIHAPDRQPAFAPPVVEAICQIAYEAVSNIVRHAQATRAVLEVTESQDRFQLTITDNGQGIDPQQAKEGGLGLRNISQRARIHGGDVSIEPLTGGGTRLTLRLPV